MPNDLKSSRYHRSRRRTICVSLGATAALSAALVLTGGSVQLRDAAGGSVVGYVLLFGALHEIVTLPLTWYRTCLLERQYGLSGVSTAAWLREYVKTAAVVLAIVVIAAEIVCGVMRMWPAWWWLAAAAGTTLMSAALTSAAPILILPLFDTSRPLGRESLRRRLEDLSRRAGVGVLTVHEGAAGASNRRAGAALVGAGVTRRILLSETLLADYTEDEIEVVLAHELAHHLHRDVLKSLAAEFLVSSAAFLAAAVVLNAGWTRIGLASPFDAAGLPIVMLAAGGVFLAATPLLNALSRYTEHQADKRALELSSRPEAFASALRRMAAQNVTEERPSRMARWLFHTHPTVEERIRAADGRRGVCGGEALRPSREARERVGVEPHAHQKMQADARS